MPSTTRQLLTEALAEAAEHRKRAVDLVACADEGRLGDRLLAKAQVHATLSLSCEQRAMNLWTAIESGIDRPVLDSVGATSPADAA